MELSERGDSVTLSTGRVIPCYDGIIGLSLDPDKEGDLFYGHDGRIESHIDESLPEELQPSEPRLTEGERQEIAEVMITLWRKWAYNL